MLGELNELAIKTHPNLSEVLMGRKCVTFSIDLPDCDEDRRQSFIADESGKRFADIRMDIMASTKRFEYRGVWLYGNLAFEMFRVFHSQVSGDGPSPARLGWFWASDSDILIIRNPRTTGAYIMRYSSIRPAVASYIRRVNITNRLVVRGVGKIVTSTVLLVPFYEIQEHVFKTKIAGADREKEVAAWNENSLLRSDQYVSVG